MIDDDGKLRRKYTNKKHNARKEGISFGLTFEEFIALVASAGLASSDLGFTGKGYVLARIGDVGSYTVGNCRFITQLENAREKKFSPLEQAASRRNIKLANIKLAAMPFVERSNIIRQGQLGYTKERRAKAVERRKKFEGESKRKKTLGKGNSQHGTFWLTDGSVNLKWSLERGDFPEGYYRGRVRVNW